MYPLSLLLLQATDATVPTHTESMNLLDMILSGGAAGVTIIAVQVLQSIIALYVFFERYATISKAGKIDETFMNNIRMNVQTGNIQAALMLCRNTDTPVARMVEKGLQRIGKPLRDIDAAIENVGNLEVFKLEKNLSILASIAGSAPMLGFFGTVTGMILAFYNMSTAENVTPALLAGGIYQALLTTAVGLFVGIPALIGYNVLVNNMDKVVFQMERNSMEFMDLLQEPAK